MYSLNENKFKYDLDYYFNNYDDYYKGYSELEIKTIKNELISYLKTFMCKAKDDENELYNIVNTVNYYEDTEIDENNMFVCGCKKNTNYNVLTSYFNHIPDIKLNTNYETYLLLDYNKIIMIDIDDSFKLYNLINKYQPISMICKLNSVLKILLSEYAIEDILRYYEPEIKNITFIDYDLLSIISYKFNDNHKFNDYRFKTLYNYDKNKFMNKIEYLHNKLDKDDENKGKSIDLNIIWLMSSIKSIN